MPQDGASAILARIQPTTDYPDLTGCELVVEAVFEDRALKADVTKKTEAVIGKDAIFASNTSTLPITGLAEASSRPANFIGLHFFSPAEKMPLVEIILGKQTSPATLARAMDFVRAIGKTPIVVNDARGFYTSRVFGTYLSEGMALLQEGVAPALIDNAGRLAGMPVGPLALADEVSIELVHKIAKQTKADLGDRYAPRAADQVAALMAEKLGRFGKKSGHGFYDYPAGAKKHLWAGLAEHFPVKAEQPSLEQVIERLILIQSIETVRCLDEGVLASPAGRRRRRHPRLGLSAFPRRADRPDPHHGHGQFRRRLRPPGGTMRRTFPPYRKPSQKSRRGFTILPDLVHNRRASQ
jgi:3-hydroxyacyl-CoA dehydrogenase/enoyl-CoA hydratase/3-hydroxybutyryl-CoA epimerase